MKMPSIPIIRTKKEYSKFFRMYGMPNVCTKHFNKIFGDRTPVLFVDDFDDGKPMGIALKRRLLK